jgi:small subunit ribosomal protein S11
MAKAEQQPGGAEAPAKKKKAFKKRGEKRIVHHGFVHVQASFNNTLITITDAEGAVVSWSPRHRRRSAPPTPPRRSACARATCW